MELKHNLKGLVEYCRNGDVASSSFWSEMAKLGCVELFNPRKEKMPLPTFAYIEPTTLCNFKCVTCSRASLPERRKNLSLTSEQFEEILGKIPSLRRVHFQGLGEPLLTPDLQKIIDISKRRDICITTTTNGSLLRIEKYRNLALQFRSVGISFDSTTKEGFERTRIGGDFDAVIEGIKSLTKQNKMTGKKAKIGLNFVVTHLNYTQIPDMFDIAMGLGVDSINLPPVENWYIPSEKEFADSHAFALKARARAGDMRRLVLELRKRLKPHGIEVSMGSYEKGRKYKCNWPFRNVFITADGFVTPCCIRMNSAAFNFGSIYSTDDFGKIWNGQEYRNFRKANLEGLPNPICDNCPC